ncbi:MAG: caspase family protein [Candidatus Aminicenantes bacterium]|jgi:hypothetical protein
MKKQRVKRVIKICAFARTTLFFLTIVFFFILKIPIFAGGIYINKSDVKLNGYPLGTPFFPNQKILMTYTAEDYSYSGRGGELEYFIFLITKKLMVNNSVGKEGINFPDDVSAIQSGLKEIGYFKKKVSGICDSELIDAIAKFQTNIGFKNPDGKIDPDGITIKKLWGRFKPYYFVQLARRYSRYYERRDIRYQVTFTSPTVTGTYEIKYCRWPIFTRYALGRLSLNEIELSDTDIRQIKHHVNRWRGGMISLGTFEVVPMRDYTTPDVTIYLRVNNKVPGIRHRIISGVSENPTKFSWWIEKSSSVSSIYFRYRLYPDDSEWSDWSATSDADYYFINSGHHEFRVEGKFIDTKGKEKITPQVSYSFTLDGAFIAKPKFKATTRVIVKKKAESIPIKLYSKSYAILIGVSNFEDSNFSRLPYVKRDLDALASSLIKLDFIVKRLESKVTREDVITAIEEIITLANENDRILIYFSTHGFQDPIISSEGYIASSNCERNKPTVNCIQISQLDKLVKKGISKGIKHILIVIDSCFSGLGVIAKSTSYPAISRIAIKKGAHMITAGMADQLAEMDHKLKMSTFTFFLTQGLSGNADYTGDSIITVSELLLYVQYEVAKKTNAAQIPMIGRILGEGEMIFDIRNLNKR